MFPRHLLSIALGLVTLVPRVVFGGTALIGNLGGLGPNGGYGTGGPLPPNDDSYSSAIDITPAFPMGLNFFGKTYTSMYVNTNGNITFNAGLAQYTPTAFPVSSQPMIAAFWADVDVRGTGAPTTNGVWWYLESGRIIITWSMVGYFSIHDDKKNDFQMILTSNACGNTDFDVEFRYNQIQWTTGDVSGGSGGLGGTTAQVGFDAGDSTNFVQIPDSRTANIINLPMTSNVSIPGTYRFQIRNGMVSGGCAGGGMACDTGLKGACAAGIGQCAGAGISCNPVASPMPERCDGVDNDCNGTVDDGMGLCPDGQLCDQGTCVDICYPELGCPRAGDVCTDRGSCVDPACAMVDCPPGERCKNGTCVMPCDNVTCPHGQVCRAGRCVDPCEGVTCGDPLAICVNGVCVPVCQCNPCMAGSTCQMNGTCVTNDCVGKACPAGQYCSQGVCVPDCMSAICPDGQICMGGQCVQAPPMDMATPPDMTEVPDLAPAASNDVPDLGGGKTGSSTGTGPNHKRAGGCQMTPSGSDGALALIFFGALAILVRRRRES